MNKFRFALQTFVLAALFLVFSNFADAQATRTWVSGVGDDVNPCSRSAPCRTFIGALSKTATNGEINCLDAGSFGTVTITKSITIDCEDTQGAITAAAAFAVTVNITGANDAEKSVRLRGLSINGLGLVTNGIKILAGNQVVLEQIVIDGFTTHGVSIENSAGALLFVMKDTTIRNNGGNGVNTFLTGAATASISIDNSLLAFNGIGFNQGAATTSTIENSGITNNSNGLQASGSTSILGVKNCVISHNGTGVLSNSSATVRIGGNIITSNTFGLSGNAIISTWNAGSNFIDGNTVDNGSINGFSAVQ